MRELMMTLNTEIINKIINLDLPHSSKKKVSLLG